MSRRELRERIFKLLFSIEFNSMEEMETQTEFFFEAEENQADVADTAYISEKCARILDRLDQIDHALNQNVRGLWLLLFLLGAMLLCLIPENNCKSISENHYFHAVLAAGAFVWAFLCISSESVFVYFNF